MPDPGDVNIAVVIESARVSDLRARWLDMRNEARTWLLLSVLFGISSNVVDSGFWKGTYVVLVVVAVVMCFRPGNPCLQAWGGKGGALAAA